MDLGDGWEIAGWGPHGGSSADWHNTEKGDDPPTEADLYDSDITVKFTDTNGIVHYFSIMDGVDGWEGLDDAIHHLAEHSL